MWSQQHDGKMYLVSTISACTALLLFRCWWANRYALERYSFSVHFMCRCTSTLYGGLQQHHEKKQSARVEAAGSVDAAIASCVDASVVAGSRELPSSFCRRLHWRYLLESGACYLLWWRWCLRHSRWEISTSFSKALWSSVSVSLCVVHVNIVSVFDQFDGFFVRRRCLWIWKPVQRRLWYKHSSAEHRSLQWGCEVWGLLPADLQPTKMVRAWNTHSDCDSHQLVSSQLGVA